MSDIITTIRKNERAEIRVVRQLHKMRPCIDIRVWYVPAGQAEFVPTRKGVTFDAGKLPDLLAALAAELP